MEQKLTPPFLAMRALLNFKNLRRGYFWEKCYYEVE